MKTLSLLLALIFATTHVHAQAVREIGAEVINYKQQASAPASPSSGNYKAYVRDSKLRLKDSSGNESTVGTGAGAENLLTSGNMEDGTSAWTLTAGTKADESTVVIEGVKAAKLTLSAQTLDFYQTSTSHQSQFADGVQGIARARIKTTVSGVFLCSRQAGSIQYNNCAAVSSDGKWGLYKALYVLGGTSNGIAVISGTYSTATGLVTPGTITGDVYVDDAYVGTDAGVADIAYTSQTYQIKQAQSSMTNRNIEAEFALGTATIVNNGTPLLVASDDSANTRTKFTATQAVSITIVWKPAITTIGTAATIYKNGTLWGGAAPNVSTGNYAVNAASVMTLASGEYFSVGTEADMSNSAATASLEFIAVASSQVLSSQCGSRCETELSAKVSAAGVVSDEEADWINGNTVISSTSVYTFTFNSGLFSATPNCFAQSNAASAVIPLLYSQTTTGMVVQMYVSNSSGTANAQPFTVTCRKTGADYQSARMLAASLKVPDAQLILEGGNGHGSTNTKIRRFTSIREQVGQSFYYTYADSATLGGSVTINVPGLYFVEYNDRATAASEWLAITVNDTAPTTSISSITSYAQGTRSITGTASTFTGVAATLIYLNTNDVVRAHTNGVANETSNGLVYFTLRKVSL